MDTVIALGSLIVAIGSLLFGEGILLRLAPWRPERRWRVDWAVAATGAVACAMFAIVISGALQGADDRVQLLPETEAQAAVDAAGSSAAAKAGLEDADEGFHERGGRAKRSMHAPPFAGDMLIQASGGLPPSNGDALEDTPLVTMIPAAVMGALVELNTPGMSPMLRQRIEAYLDTSQAQGTTPAPYALSLQISAPQMLENSECMRAPTIRMRYIFTRRGIDEASESATVEGSGCLDHLPDVPGQERHAERQAVGALIETLRLKITK